MLGIGMLILSVIHVPLPQADFHNIRHHDGPGQICIHHDHLLRWHPLAESNEDVALLHWHWFVPAIELGNPNQQSDDDNHRPGSGPALHAHVGDGLQPDDWRSEPVLQPASGGRLLVHIALGHTAACSADFSVPVAADSESARLFGPSHGPVDGLRAARTALVERWNC
jgi:hypothetical protein